MYPEFGNKSKNSMLYWYPKIENTDIPKPKTVIIPIKDFYKLKYACSILDGNMIDEISEIRDAIEKVGIPAFLRTDLTSAKHNWIDTCYLDSDHKLEGNLYNLIEFSLMVDLIPAAFIVREYIPLESQFTAYNASLPIAKERSYFIKNSKILCHHPYWPEAAIDYPDHPNWRRLLAIANEETDNEIELLSKYALKISEVMEGFWSVDFAKAKDGRWILIDMAQGERSYHPMCEMMDNTS